MSGNKKLAQSIAVAGMTGMLAFTATFSQPQIIQTNETVQIAKNGTAGVIAALTQYEQLDGTWSVTIEKNDIIKVASIDTSVITQEAKKSRNVKEEEASIADTAEVVESTEDTDEESVEITKSANTKVMEQEAEIAENTEQETAKEVKSVEKTEETVKEAKKELAKKSVDETQTAEKKTKTKASIKKAAKEKTEKETTKEKKEEAEETEEKTETKQSAEKKKWEKMLMADVEDFLYIRESGSEDSQIVGKLYKGDAATVIKKGKVWTKISSGSVEGYVKNEYCLYGTKAYKLAKKICKTCATVNTDALRVRSEASEDASVIRVASKGEKLVVNTDAKSKKGWVAVTVDGTDGYVSSEYVTVGLGVGEAISIEEEQQQIAARKKAEQEAVAAASSDMVTSYEMTPAVSSSDLTLLSAIIYCEAGGESYSGQVAVGAVVMNRVKSGNFPNTIYGVIYQSGQFSPVSNGSLAKALNNGSYKKCTAAAQTALAGTDNTNGAKFFHRAGGSSSGLVIGHHVFY